MEKKADEVIYSQLTALFYTLILSIGEYNLCERNMLAKDGGLNGGADGVRTHYLLTASQTLSQLSYSPMFAEAAYSLT